MLYIKKYFCVFVSAVLLLSNTQVFAQNAGEVSNIISQAEIEELITMSEKIRAKYNKALYNISLSSRHLQSLARGESQVKSSLYILDYFEGSFKVYYKDMAELEDLLHPFHQKMRETYAKYIDALPEGTYLKKVTKNYINERMNTLFQAQKHHLDNVLSLRDILKEQPELINMERILKPYYMGNESIRRKHVQEFYAKDVRERNYFLKNLADNQEYFRWAFDEDVAWLFRQLKKAESAFSQEAVAFFSKKTHTAEEILTYFAKRLPEDQKALLFALKTSDNGITMTHLIPHIRYYLKKVNRRLWKLEKFSAENLKIALSKMSLAKRTEFIDDLLDFTPATKALRQEVKQAEKAAGKRIVNRGGIKLAGTFMLIGSILVAASITDIIADNNFNATMGIKKMAEIQNKIDRGQPIALQEMFDFYTSERNQYAIAQNPLGLLEVFEAAITVNELLDELDTQTEADPEIEDYQENINNAFDKHLNKIDLNKVTSKTGTL